MKSIIVLLAVVCCMAVVRGAHLHKYEDKNIDNKHIQDNINPVRHNRRRRQPLHNNRNNYYNSNEQRRDYDRSAGYNANEQRRDYDPRDEYNVYEQRTDYDPRDEYNVYEQRTDYDRRHDYLRQSESLPKILDKLIEILFHMKMSKTLPPPSPPPPPPQVIVINVPRCDDNTIQTRMLDPVRNWGKVVSDGSRPINFNIMKPDEPTVIPPPVEHGTIQAGISPVYTSTELGPCKAAILVCCQYPSNQIKQCFTLYGCEKLYNKDHRDSCDTKVVENVVRLFSKAYAPY